MEKLVKLVFVVNVIYFAVNMFLVGFDLVEMDKWDMIYTHIWSIIGLLLLIAIKWNKFK